MQITVRVKTAPTVYPVTLADVANMVAYDLTNPTHVREEAYLTSLIKAATRMLEDYLGRAFITQTLKMVMVPDLQAYPTLAGLTYGYESPSTQIKIRRPPCQKINSINIYDQAAAAHLQAATLYSLNIDAEPAVLQLVDGASWGDYVRGYYVIDYDAGYGATAATVPEEIINAIKMTIGQWYKDREQSNYTIPATATALVDHLKIESWDL